ncbi:hypothetical protein MKZ38_000321 [Zalerion maritima]|uniref:Uncharacterized protein n=1 Tax=Zalerion maritima TaxID=339359 RepID=A0AAD5RFL3_9PEZI|nr:hypothetical protein MKZ38_000321 [Zalerion maritima]
MIRFCFIPTTHGPIMRPSLQPASQPAHQLLTRSFTTSACLEARRSFIRKKPPSQHREPQPLYQSNRLTADLGNIFLKGVRFVTPEDDEAWEKIWVTEPERREAQEQREKFARIAKTINRNKEEFQYVKANPLSPYRISESDLYSLAFLGTPDPTTLRNRNPAAVPLPKAALRRVLKRNGILSGDNDDAETIKLMINRRNTINSTQASSIMKAMKQYDPRNMVEATMDPKEFLQWHRYISNASQDLSTIDVVLQHEHTLVAEYAKMGGELGTDSEALATLNNLSINLSRRERVIGKHYCFLGLILACRLVSVPSIRRYLDIGLREEYFTSQDERRPSELDATPLKFSRAWETPHSTLHYALSTLLGLLEKPQAFPAKSCSSRSLLYGLLELLTGRQLLVSESQPCFRAAIGSSIQYFPAYAQFLRILGQLGSYSLIWHEYHSQEARKFPDMHTMGKTSALKDTLFTMAVIEASGFRRGHVIRRDALKQSEAPDHWQDCLSELRRIKAMPRSFGYGTNAPEKKGHKLDGWNGAMQDLNSARLSPDTIREVMDALGEPFEDDALSALQDVISTFASAK